MKSLVITFCILLLSLLIVQLSADCPLADLNKDCQVNLQDYAVMASEWLTEGIPTDPDVMVWVSINDPGVPGHERFEGQMSKYETTNAQYCQFLNEALASGDIIVDANDVIGANGTNGGADFVGQVYYDLAGPGDTYDGAINGGAARIHYSGGVFTVGDSRFENHPVTYVSWYGATAFCNYYGYRLPTEWEWQAVADYDGSFTYGCGTTIDINSANILGSIHSDGTTIVGSFGAYGYDMCDMAGNVYEWTSSCYYTDCSGDYRVGRSGAWGDQVYTCAVSFRYQGDPDHKSHGIGFRVCRDNPIPTEIVWVSINDAGVSGHESFIGKMSKYETTNAQYCQFLNEALASGDIIVDGSDVVGANGTNSGADFAGQVYYDLAGGGYNYCGVTNGGAARINYSSGVFTVDSGFENHPVTYVSWYGATAFCNYYGYRLPTEWEWKAVADYDGSYPYGCGTTIDNSHANYCGSIHPDGTTVIGSFYAYGYGMCDMAGNVWEWTSSLCNPPQDGRSMCGGCWANLEQDLVTVWKTCDYPYTKHGTVGFRVCRDVEPSGMGWVPINDPGVPGHEGFNGQMSKYETTNTQYCQFLNEALATGDITVSGDSVLGANGTNGGADYVGQVYYQLDGLGNTYNGAINGGAARINYSDGLFTVVSGFENHPVTYVSWYGATTFCNYYGYRLPTEWEWQAVADYDGTFTYGCGTSINNSIANYYNSTHPDGTTIVGSFGDPSGYGYGMCDMAGNVLEWTSTISGSNIYFRGGGWRFNSSKCTVTWSDYGVLGDLPGCDSGFRVCR